MTPEAYTTRVYSQLLLLFTRQPTAAGRWLAAVQSGPPGHVTQRVTCLVAAIFVSVTDTDVESLCLKTLVEISQKEPTQVCSWWITVSSVDNSACRLRITVLAVCR